MRITGGGIKGRSVPNKKLNLRPTTNRAKQGLLNILHHRLAWENCLALDLFSGTGSISYELSSRGCKQITAIDINPANIGFIRNNVKQLGLTNIIIVRSDALSFLRSHKEPYDLIIADPPYDYHHYPVIPELIFEKHLLKENGLLIIEHSKRTSFKGNPYFTEQRTYGEVNFSFFGYKKPEAENI